MGQYWVLSVALPNERNHEVVSEYLLNLKLANRSPGTVNLYCKFLEKFFGNQKKSFDSLTSEEILDWYLTHEREIKEATYRLRLSILSSFYKFCIQEDYMENSPLKTRWLPTLPKAIPKYLEKKEIAKTRIQGEKISLRNQLLVEFMLSSGCRVAEVVGLNREDIDLENRTATVLGKGRKIRKVHFSEKCALLFERYFENMPTEIQAVFVQTTGRRIGSRAIQIIMNNLGDEIGLSSPLFPHRLRHTFATELVTKGVELSFISEEMGHKNLTTTQIYARVPNHELISMYRKYMG